MENENIDSHCNLMFVLPEVQVFDDDTGDVASTDAVSVDSEYSVSVDSKLTWMIEKVLGISREKCCVTSCEDIDVKIALVEPRLIVALGKPVVNTLSGIQGVLGFLRGRILDCVFGSGIIVIGTFSPDYFVQMDSLGHARGVAEKGLQDDMSKIRFELKRMGLWESLRLPGLCVGDKVTLPDGVTGTVTEITSPEITSTDKENKNES